MNLFLWTLQILLALHTAIGGFWKISNSEKTVPSLQAIPHSLWLAMSVVEFLLCLALILPGFNKRLAFLAPVAAVIIGVKMLFFSGMDLYSGKKDYSHMIYWLAVGMICGVIIYGRCVLAPINKGMGVRG